MHLNNMAMSSLPRWSAEAVQDLLRDVDVDGEIDELRTANSTNWL